MALWDDRVNRIYPGFTRAVMNASPGNLTHLLQQWNGGDLIARDCLLELVYTDMRKYAGAFMRAERKGHVLQATALANEVCVRLLLQERPNWKNRFQFFRVVALLMNRVLVDVARSENGRRAGGQKPLRVTLSQAASAWTDGPERIEAAIDAVAVAKKLEELRELDGVQTEIVCMKFYFDLTNEQVAEALNVSRSTVDRKWSLAKAWLHRELRKRDAS